MTKLKIRDTLNEIIFVTRISRTNKAADDAWGNMGSLPLRAKPQKQ